VFGVTQHSFNLFASYTGKPFEEVIDTSAAFEIREESLNRNARTYKKPRHRRLSQASFQPQDMCSNQAWEKG
jgi:hypothetical protein